MTYHCEGYKTRPAKGRAQRGQALGTRCRILRVLSWGATWRQVVQALSSRKLSWDWAPGSFLGAGHTGHPLPSIHPNSRLPEGKQVLSINHSVCTNSLGAIRASLISPSNIRKQNPSSQMPAKGPLAQACLRPALLTLCCEMALLFSTGKNGYRIWRWLLPAKFTKCLLPSLRREQHFWSIMGKALFPVFGISWSLLHGKQPWGAEHGVTTGLLNDRFFCWSSVTSFRASGAGHMTIPSVMRVFSSGHLIHHRLCSPNSGHGSTHGVFHPLLFFCDWFSGFSCFTLCLGLISHKTENSLRTKQQTTCSYRPRASLAGWSTYTGIC